MSRRGTGTFIFVTLLKQSNVDLFVFLFFVFFPYTCPFRHRQRLETLLKELTPSRADIANAMLFCLERADAAEEVVGHITESFSLLQTPLQKKASAVFSSISINTCMRNAFV